MALDIWLASLLSCPIDGSDLRVLDDDLECEQCHTFPVVDGVPVLLREDVPPTHPAIQKTLSEVRENRVDSLRLPQSADGIDPVVQIVVSATCGRLYAPLVNTLERYPIPRSRLPAGDGKTLLDIGCNWGRWTFSAARQGYRAIGIDPDLGPVLAAKRIATQLGIEAHFVVGDARWLPFKSTRFDSVFSYSVIQHFSKGDARLAIADAGRVLKRGGTATIQMPNAYGIRNIAHQVTHRRPQSFDVRYWTPGELEQTFIRLVGPTRLSVDGFFGLGIQPDDVDMLPLRFQLVVKSSEALRSAARRFPPLRFVADSLYATSEKTSARGDDG